MDQTTVLFVCTGNTCRSPMAAAAFTHLCRQGGLTDVTVLSAGLNAATGTALSPQARFALWQRGIATPDDHASQPLTLALAESADQIVVMTRQHREQLCARLPHLRAKTRLLLANPETDVPDPFGGDSETYIHCLDQMFPALTALAKELAAGGR